MANLYSYGIESGLKRRSRRHWLSQPSTPISRTSGGRSLLVSPLPIDGTSLVGGWNQTESLVVNDPARALLEFVVAKRLANLDPVTLIKRLARAALGLDVLRLEAPGVERFLAFEARDAEL